VATDVTVFAPTEI